MIFVDTGPFVARYVARDQYHEVAVGAWAELEHGTEQVVTSNFVLDETLTLLSRRAGAAFAADRGHALFRSAQLEILRPDRADEQAAVEIMRRFDDQPLSFTDCVSFVLMERARIRRAFTFDRHFRMVGLEKWPLTPA